MPFFICEITETFWIFFDFKPGRRVNPAVEEDVRRRALLNFKTLCFEAFI